MMISNTLRALSAAGLAALLSACGTTYTMPGIGDETTTRASVMFAEAKSAPPRALASESTGGMVPSWSSRHHRSVGPATQSDQGRKIHLTQAFRFPEPPRVSQII